MDCQNFGPPWSIALSFTLSLCTFVIHNLCTFCYISPPKQNLKDRWGWKTKHCTNHKRMKAGPSVSEKVAMRIKPTATHYQKTIKEAIKMMKMKKHWTQKPKGKWESLIRGETKCIGTSQKKENPNTQLRFSPQTVTENQLMVLTC